MGQRLIDEDEAEEEQSANLRLVAQEESDNEEICLRASNPNKWYIDSGCSRHMTGDQSKFASIKHKEGGKVTFGGNESRRIAWHWQNWK
ncbi:hypothetical protein K1719_002449 [Acacia pycnantha]|nr:hypothetical protein K1719_002449 [Acacia pycnantha]